MDKLLTILESFTSALTLIGVWLISPAGRKVMTSLIWSAVTTIAERIFKKKVAQ
jgi:hypothetical protein